MTAIRTRSLFAAALWLLLGAKAAGAAEPPPPSLLPAAANLRTESGHYRPGASAIVAIAGDGAELRELAELGASLLKESWRVPVQVRTQAAGRADLTLTLRTPSQPQPENHAEAYALDIDTDGIRLQATTTAGLFYGLQTLRQLAPPDDADKTIPALHIDDAPRFGHRGLMLDVGRHLFPVEFIKRQLDLMARYKFNTLHWHLTDDQGWRLEIKRYPRLTEVGAWRRETVVGQQLDPYVGDGRRYGGFYTQEQAREIVAYARKLHITVIPEIDMPGHMVAALAAYPELACTPGPFEVRTTWGVDDNILCPSEPTFEFVTGVLSEVMEVFPSRYIHLGGDEAPTVRWEQSALAQEIIRRERLKDEHALQGWFLRRIEKFVNDKGRRIIGWDEILDGDPSPTATVMSWRGMSGGIKAAQRGHDVIMTPTDHAYLDYCQGDPAHEPVCFNAQLPLSQVYAFEPVPAVLAPRQARHILGGQGNLWTEYIKTPEQAEYMLWPRALALAEVLWSPRDARDWADFQRRLPSQLAALDRLEVNYRVPEEVQQPAAQSLDGAWQFRLAPGSDQAGAHADATQWRKATVPGTVHTDLLAHALIPDPYVGAPEAGLQWIGLADWEYRRSFDVDAATLERARADLVFEGLDTFAEVWLNDEKMLSADNFHPHLARAGAGQAARTRQRIADRVRARRSSACCRRCRRCRTSSPATIPRPTATSRRTR